MNEQYYIVEIPHQRSPKAYGPMTGEEIISLAQVEQSQWLANQGLWDTELTLAQAIDAIGHDLSGCQLIPANEVVDTLESWRELWRDPHNHGFPAAYWRLAEAIADSEYAEEGPVKMLAGLDITDPTAERLLGMMDFQGHYPIAAPSDTPGGFAFSGQAVDGNSSDADDYGVIVENEVLGLLDDFNGVPGYRTAPDGDGVMWIERV
jgi:hypothetical protein